MVVGRNVFIINHESHFIRQNFDIICTNFKSCTSMRVYKNEKCHTFNGISTQEVSSCDDGSAIRWCRRKQSASTSVIFLKFSEFLFFLFKVVSEYTHLGLHIMANLTLPLDESILRIALSISLPSSLEWLTYTLCLGIPTSNQQTSFFVGDNLLGQKSFANTGVYIGFVEVLSEYLRTALADYFNWNEFDAFTDGP